jgi:predicted acyl esterase
MMGPDEQRDMADIIEWVAEQPWCTGKVGMMGCSYFAMTQNLAAEQQPPSLKAIFPYDAATDQYRDFYFTGGIPHDGFTRIWFSDVTFLNFWGGRNPNTAALTQQFETILGMEYPLDGEFYWQRSAWPNLDKIQVPAYFGCHWPFYNLHLRGTFDAWHSTGDITKRMVVGPAPLPQRQYANYHMEALRWYDQFLKDMDTRVLEGAPIHLWIEGEDVWRDEYEWPLARTRWTEFYLGGEPGQGTLTDVPPANGEQTLNYDPSNEQQWIRGEPRWIYRSEPLDQPVEVTGPIQLNLTMASTVEDTDWIVILQDEAPDGSLRELTRGWLRSSHRAVDPDRARPNQPWHPHNRVEPLIPNHPEALAIEVIPTCNLFGQGHRIRLELANCDSIVTNNFWYKRALPIPAQNTVIQGPGQSHIILPVIPR